ncbi:hypothetical protein [Singulisphaera sp. GP187]|uniref:hypothetical protein n=1 Tax=Singulisphaera sp. GP187 TaxID=1882752 RepID=UPI0009410B3F|nr:hypothetical protein [Singulisphaera sp. GP187]
MALVLAPIVFVGVASASDDVLDRFRKEYRQAASRLEAVSDQLRCQADFEITGLNDHTKIQKLILYKQKKILVVNHNTLLRGKKIDDAYVFCVTPEYSFQLHSQYQAGKPGPYVLRSVGLRDETSRNFLEGVSINSIHTTNQNYAIDKDRLADLLWDDHCKISQATLLPAAAGESEEARKVELQFDNSSANHWVGGGRLVFDPSLDWAVTEYDLDINSEAPGQQTIPKGSKRLGKIVNRRWPDVGVFPERVEYIYRYPHGDDKKVADITAVSRDEIEDSAFTLAAYGLPDIYVRAKPRDHTVLLLLALGVGFLLVSLLLKRLSPR